MKKIVFIHITQETAIKSMCKKAMKVSLIIQILGRRKVLREEMDEQALFVLPLLLPNCQPKLKIILSTKLEESLWFSVFVYSF